MEFQVEVCQASKWRGTKPVILARHTTLAICTRQDSNLPQMEECQANDNYQGTPPYTEVHDKIVSGHQDDPRKVSYSLMYTT